MQGVTTLVLLSCFCFVLWPSLALITPRTRAQRIIGNAARQVGSVAVHTVRKDLLSSCEEKWRDATLDHFTWVKRPGNPETFRQRYFVCANSWQPSANGSPGPIFFYLGNEADVLLYLNNTGLMWESASQFGAMLVFAEHRYYGRSVPFGKDVERHMGYLSAEQAMADYAELVQEIKEAHGAHDSAVIGFGGSYGGMLAAWMRMKYPHVLDGAIAASAPIWNFFGEEPAFDSGSFAAGVTYDTSEEAGSRPHCTDNVRRAWTLLDKYGADVQGRAFLATSLRLCSDVPLADAGAVVALRDWLSSAWDYMAMGNFPYPSSYILNGNGQLPAFPVRAACAHLGQPGLSDADLLEALASAVGVYYNHSGALQCADYRVGVNPESVDDGHFWDYQWCTEMLMPFSRDGVKDMFWAEPFDLEGAMEGCREGWGITPRALWANTQWGGRRIAAASNIVFSNGLLDPWHGGGVLADVSDSLLSVVIPEGAHHLDLMFSHPDDPLSVKEVRNFQRARIRDWIAAAAETRRCAAAAATVATAANGHGHAPRACSCRPEHRRGHGPVAGAVAWFQGVWRRMTGQPPLWTPEDPRAVAQFPYLVQNYLRQPHGRAHGNRRVL